MPLIARKLVVKILEICQNASRVPLGCQDDYSDKGFRECKKCSKQGCPIRPSAS